MSDFICILARINHSCIPNLRHYSSVESGDMKDVGMTIKAARDILPGEQVRSLIDFLICALYFKSTQFWGLNCFTQPVLWHKI